MLSDPILWTLQKDVPVEGLPVIERRIGDQR